MKKGKPSPTAGLRPPEMTSGLPWDVRPFDEASVETTEIFGICSAAHYALRRVDYALRVALLTVLPLAILTTNDTTSWVFVEPSIALVCAIVVPNPRIGTSIMTLAEVLASIAIHQAIAYIAIAIEPSRHWALWFAVYIVLMLGFGFFTQGLVTKLSCFFFNILLVMEWHGSYPQGDDGYKFVGRFAISVLIGAGIGGLTPFIPYPHTNRDDAERALRSVYRAIAICFEGCTQSVYVKGPRPSVQRRVNVRHIAGARASLERHLSDLTAAVALMRYEPHFAATHDQFRLRAAVACELRSSIDGLYGLVNMIARHPNLVDESEIVQGWGRRISPELAVASGCFEEFCSKLGEISYELTDADHTYMEELRDAMREVFDSVRHSAITDSDSRPTTPPPMGAPHFYPETDDAGPGVPSESANGANEVSQYPFLFLGFFAICHGRALRTVSSMPIGEGWQSRMLHDDQRCVVLRQQAEGRAASGSGSREPLADDAGGVSNGSGLRDEDAASVDNATFVALRLPSPSLNVAPIESMARRVALYWPRAIRDALLLIPALLRGETSALVRLREAVKLTFAMTAALAVILYFGEELPAGGSAVIAFAKEGESAATMLGSIDFMAATITGSVYGFLAVSLASTENQLIGIMCVIVLVCSYVRAHPRYSVNAFLVTFFAVSTMASGVADDRVLIHTVLQNVASMTWLAITHAFLWPLWPSNEVQHDVVASTKQLRELMQDLFHAIASSDSEEGQRLALAVMNRRKAMAACIGHARSTVSLAATEPTLKRGSFPDRRFHRVLDALDALASLLFPVATAANYIHELPYKGKDEGFVPTQVIELVRTRTPEAAKQIDTLLNGIVSMWETELDVSATLLQSLEDSVAALDRCIAAAAGLYMARLGDSRSARPYEMSAINAMLHFYATLSGALNYAVEASIDAHRALMQVK